MGAPFLEKYGGRGDLWDEPFWRNMVGEGMIVVGEMAIVFTTI